MPGSPKKIIFYSQTCLSRSLICGDVNFFNQKPELRSSCILLRYLDQISPEILKVTIARNESTLEDKSQASTLQDYRYIHEHWHFIRNKSGAWYIFRFKQEYIRTVLQFKRNGTETSRYVAWTKRGSGYLFSARDGYCHFQQQFGPLFRRPLAYTLKGNGNSLRLRYSPARGHIPWRI